MLKGTLFLILSRIIFVISGYVIHIAAAWYFGVREYGYLGILLSLITIIRVFFANGVPQSVSKFTAQNIDKKSEILKSGLWITVVGSLTIASIYFLCTDLIADFLKEESLKNLIRLTGIIIPTMAIFQLYHGSLNGQRLFGKQAFVLSFYAVGRILFSLIFVIFGFKIGGIILGYICSSIAALFLARHFTFRIGKKQFYPRKRIIKYAIPLLLSSIGIVIILNIDILYVKNILLSPESAGYYIPAIVLGKIPYVLFFPFAMTFLPTIAHSYSIDPNLKSIIEKGMRQLVVLLMPILILLSGFAKEIISILYKNEYIIAVAPLRILSFGFGFLAIYASIMAIFSAINPKVPIIISTSGVILQAVLCYLLIDIYGISGAAIATSITSLSLLIAGIILLKLYFKSFLPIIMVIRIGIASSIVYLFVLFISSLAFNKFVIFIYSPIAVGLYFGFLYILGEIKYHEISKVFVKTKSVLKCIKDR